ncbi:hypothetical protein MMC14_005852 [Varicellaria rhodocarpa]|nr:hypothetical protein [Varicellaria rhodocarpa]
MWTAYQAQPNSTSVELKKKALRELPTTAPGWTKKVYGSSFYACRETGGPVFRQWPFPHHAVPVALHKVMPKLPLLTKFDIRYYNIVEGDLEMMDPILGMG